MSIKGMQDVISKIADEIINLQKDHLHIDKPELQQDVLRIIKENESYALDKDEAV